MNQMQPKDVSAKGADWSVSLDEMVGQQGTIRLKTLGAVNGTPVAQLDLWAVDRSRALDFLRGLVSTLESKWGRLVIPRNLSN